MNKRMVVSVIICGLLVWGFLLQRCEAEGLFLTVGAGKNQQLFSSSSDWNDADSTGAFIAVFYQWNKQAWCFDCYPSVNYAHLSQWESGCPWDCGTSEDTIDHLGIAATWAIWEN